MDVVEEVKARLNIEDVVGEYVELKRAGRNWRGLSPFTSERTPSFMVSPEKQIWHDFSSGKGGNMFGFVMEMEGLDFKGALELLARKSGVDIEQYRAGPRSGPNKARLLQLLELTTKFYQLHLSKNRLALEYVFQKRQFSKETVLTWRLGYSPNTGDALVAFLKGRGFSEAEMKQAGVGTQRYRGLGDMFRGRLMIPLQDPFGVVIGFTARLLADEQGAPKYINTPQTVLYDKSRHVFGLHLAKEAIRKSRFVVVAEGNLDVIASHQVSVHQVVATAGTAMTEQHLKALCRFTTDIRLSFDADGAGLAATERAIPIASKVGVGLSIIAIAGSKDPDELIRQDPQLWRSAITQHQYALDWLIERYKSLLDLETAQGKRQFSDVLLPVVRRLSDAVEQDHYMTAIAEVINVRRDALDTKLAATTGGPSRVLRRRTSTERLDKRQLEYSKAQEHLLALVFLQPRLHDYLHLLTADMFTKDEAKSLLEFLQAHPTFDGSQGAWRSLVEAGRVTSDVKGVQNLTEYVKILGLQYEELYQDLELTELEYEVARLQRQLVEEYVKHQKQTLAARLEGVDEDQTVQLLERVKQLDSLLKRVKGGM